MDWYPRNPQKFDGGTLGFTLAERGAYSGLTDYYYWSGEALPNDDKKLAALLRVSVEEWLTVAPKVKRKFRVKGKKLFHDVCEKNLKDQRRISTRSRNNGKSGGRPKASNNPAGSQRVAGGGAGSNPEITTGQDRTGQDITKNLNTSIVPVAARANGSSNGHVHGSQNGKSLDFNSPSASRPPPRINWTSQQKTERWFQNCQTWMQEHWPEDRTESAITSYLNGDNREINVASAERDAMIEAAKLRESISPSPKRKAPQI